MKPDSNPSAAGPVSISFSNIGLTFPSKSGDPIVALDGVSCGAQGGQVTAIIGPSGCGKSTLLKIARGFLLPTRGSVGFTSADGQQTSRPVMTTVWQAFNLFPWLTVLDNVRFGLKISCVPDAESIARARAAIIAVDLSGFEDKFPGQLSGGMRQRVGLARALVMRPDVLLLDEPFGALDAQTRLVLQEQLVALVESTGATAILVTHSIEEALLLSDKVIAMTARPGRVAAEITVDLPRPRSMATTHTARYAELFDAIYVLLRKEVTAALVDEAVSA